MACLASRFPYDSTITVEALACIEQAEGFLRNEMGFRQVRVRHHGDTARIEVEPAGFPSLLREDSRERIVAYMKALGYIYVTVDLEGFRSGSMNAVLAQPATAVA